MKLYKKLHTPLNQYSHCYQARLSFLAPSACLCMHQHHLRIRKKSKMISSETRQNVCRIPRTICCSACQLTVIQTFFQLKTLSNSLFCNKHVARYVHFRACYITLAMFCRICVCLFVCFLPVFSSAVDEPTVVVDTPDCGAVPKNKNLALIFSLL